MSEEYLSALLCTRDPEYRSEAVDGLVTEVRRLREALRNYGRHVGDCRAWLDHCNCGWREIETTLFAAQEG